MLHLSCVPEVQPQRGLLLYQGRSEEMIVQKGDLSGTQVCFQTSLHDREILERFEGESFLREGPFQPHPRNREPYVGEPSGIQV